MRFMLIVKANADSEAGIMPSQRVFAEMGAFNQQMIDAGIMVAAEGLTASRDGARVKLTGRRTVTDGPFAETKELIAGFWIIDVKSRQEALDWALRIPNPDDSEGEVEVRKVAGPEDFDDTMTPELRAEEGRMRAELAAKDRS